MKLPQNKSTYRMELNLLCADVCICFNVVESTEISRNIGTKRVNLRYAGRGFFEGGYYSCFERF